MAWSASRDDLAEVLQSQNPWWTLDRVPEEFAKPQSRSLVGGLRRALSQTDLRRFHIVLGPRRAGKSTVMYQLAQTMIEEGHSARQLIWLRLDHPLLLPIELGTIVKSALRRRGDHLTFFFDELAYARDWDRWLKTFYDDRWPIQVIASSSASAALRERRTESGHWSLAGMVLVALSLSRVSHSPRV